MARYSKKQRSFYYSYRRINPTLLKTIITQITTPDRLIIYMSARAAIYYILTNRALYINLQRKKKSV